MTCTHATNVDAAHDDDAVILAPIGDLQITAPPAFATAELSTANMIREFEDARLLALKKGQASAAVSATMAKAKLAGLLTERPRSKPEPAAKFDGNYVEAARRIAFLLRLSEDDISGGLKR